MPRRLLTALLVVGLTVGSARASQQIGGPCVEPIVVADADVAKRWPTAEAAVRARLREVDHIDRCARVDLVAADKHIVVVVTLGDGRSAVRHAHQVEDLPEIVEALLVLPVVAPVEAAPVEATPVEAEQALPVPPQSQPPPPMVVATPATPSAKTGGFEIGVGGAERVAGAALHVGLGVTMHAHLTYGAWHVGIAARADAINAPARNAAGDPVLVRSQALAVNAGHRFRLGAFDVDVLGGAALVAQEQLERNHGTHEALSPRFTTTVRVSQFTTKVRPFIATDVEVGAPDRRPAPPPPFVAWPFWSVGFTFGVLWVS